MGMSKREQLAALHSDLLIEFDEIQLAVRDVRMQCLMDRRFCSVTGAQWEGPMGDQFENKPRFEFNKVHLAVIRIINEYRNNRITVDFVAKDGTEADQLAETCDGLYRADEQDSGAQEAYDNAFEEGVSGGYGAIRLRAQYVDEDDDENDQQRVCIEPIFDADSCVFFSLDGKRQDKRDATKCYVLTPMTRKAYHAEYGDDPASWPKAITKMEFDWCTPDVVWIAEVYCVEQKHEMVHIFRGISLNEDEPNELKVTATELKEEGRAEELAALGFQEIRQKRTRRRKVHKYIMSGNKVLEDCGYIAGTEIPVIPYYGKRWYVDGIERCMGHVRLAKDAQMLTNMLMSWLAEMAARFDIEKPILTPEQIAGHAVMWAEDNIKKYPYLLINPILDEATGQMMPAGPIAYTKAPTVPPAMAALAQLAQQALEDLLGNQQAGEQLQPNQSGKAVELIQQRLDMQVYIYMSNFAKTIKRIGEVWLSMNKDLLIEAGRKVKVMHSSGEVGNVELLRPVRNEETGATEYENDMSQAKFDVYADVGPSSSSRRAATVRALTGLAAMTTDPETQAILTSMIMMNIEGEGLTDVQKFFRAKLVRMGAVKPTKEEAEELAAEAQNQQPDANSVYLMAAAEKQRADALKATAETELTGAKIGNTQADTIAKLAGVETQRLNTAATIATQLQPAQAPQVQ
jgi:hypothetical protein